MSEASFSHVFKLNTFQKNHIKTALETAETLTTDASPAVLKPNDQHQGFSHAAFDFKQELTFPLQPVADSTRLTEDAQVLLQVLDTLLAAEDSPASELEQVGQQISRLGQRLRQRLIDSTRQLEAQTDQVLQALAQPSVGPAAGQAVLDLQTAVQAAAARVDLTLTQLSGPLPGLKRADRQPEIQALQAGLFKPLRGLQQAHQQLVQTQTELGQMQSRWTAAQLQHRQLLQLLQDVKAGMQQLGERPEISVSLRQTLVTEVQAARPALQTAVRAQSRCEEALKRFVAVLEELRQTAAVWQQLIQDSLKLSQTLKHWSQELNQRQHAAVSEQLAAAARQALQPLAPQAETLSLLSLLAAWQTIFEETRLIYQALQAEITSQAQIERSRLLAYAEQMRTATRWHQEFLQHLDLRRAEALHSAI